MKIKINPLIYISSSLILGFALNYFISTKPLEQNLKNKDLSLVKKSKQIDSFIQEINSLKDSLNKQDSLYKKTSLENNVLKRDIVDLLIASKYYISFQSSWFTSMTHQDFTSAEELEKNGFASLYFIEDLDESYSFLSKDSCYTSVSDNPEFIAPFRLRLQPYLKKK